MRAMPPLTPDMAPPTSPSHNLSIRTAKHGKQSIQQAPSSSSSQQPYQEYPIKIPLEKQTKAVELYTAFILADLLAQNDTLTHNDGYLLPAGPPTARSVTSQTSSKHRGGAPSTSASTYDAATDYGSVVSFNQSPTSATELTSYDGKKVRTRKRKKLSPKARAKAALVRYLGSCQPCRSRRVPCPLDHHDIPFLEVLRQSMPKEEIRTQPQAAPLSAASSSSQRTARSITKQEPASSNSVSDDFLGIGAQLPEVDAMDFDKQLDMDILSSVAEQTYDNTQADRPTPAMVNPVAPNLPILNDPNPYATFKHGAPFLLGCLRNDQFQCQYLQVCQERLNTADELQDHFASAHFEFTRIDPAHLFICSVCNDMSLDATEPCRCGTPVNIELWICGHFIKRQRFQRDSSDGDDFQGYRPGPNSFDPPSFGGPNGSLPWDPNVNNRGNFGGGLNNQGPSNYQGGYGRTGNPNTGFDWNNSSGSGSGSNQYQRNIFGARQMAWDGQYNFQILCLKAQPKGVRLNSFLLLLLLSFSIVLGFTHDWLINKAYLAAASIRSHLPVLGFAILMTSLVLPLLIQHFNLRRARCVSITILLDHQAKKHADDLRRDLDVLCTLLHTLLCHLHPDQSDLNILCAVSLAYDTTTKGGNDFTLMPYTKHELQRLP